jgi:hypothetical protein
VQLLMILYKSALGMERIKELFHERAAKYDQLPGLMQKLYLSDPATGEVGGIYVFESDEQLRAFLASGLEDIRFTYQFSEVPSIRSFDVLQVLRDEWSHGPDAERFGERPHRTQPGPQLPSAPVSIPGAAPQPPVEPRK